MFTLIGTPIKCGEMVRLLHVNTKKYLHSHNHLSPLSQRQEVSGYGDVNSNFSDTGDNWKVECSGPFWLRNNPVNLQHVDTRAYLYARRSDQFNDRNCRNCPIVGQLEVSCSRVGSPSSDSYAQWQTNEGVFFPSTLHKDS